MRLLAVIAAALVACKHDAAIRLPDGGGSPDGPRADATEPPPVVGLDQRPPNPTCKPFTPPAPSGQIRLVSRFPDLHFTVPTGMFQRPGDNARWYVTERGGRVLTFPNVPSATDADVRVALDLSAVTSTDNDCSTSSLAFPPDFATSKRAYVSYCYVGPETGNLLQIRVSRFATHDGLTLDPASEQVIVALDYPYDTQHFEAGMHSADAMRFGLDGYLYVAIGDGGPQGMVGGTQSQDTSDLRGKLLRLDVSDLTKELSKDFVAGRQRVAADIPADNPFAIAGGNPAVYAYGFRNPWQWHFDRADGTIWVGDVGYNSREEVDRGVVKGGNYGWSAMEGYLCTYNFPSMCVDESVIDPLLDYTHGSGPLQGDAVTGGLVYRGSAVPSLTGAYVFGDSSGQRIWGVRDVDHLTPGAIPPKELLFSGAPVSSFAEDQNGELYATLLFPTATYGDGTILALEEAPPIAPTSGAGPPALLSQTGCFEADGKTPLAALVPFEPVAQLYSDGATKRRWLALPDGQQIALAPDGDFAFPRGSVLVKEFSLAGKRVETRFFMRQEDDGRWAGYSYRWRDDGSDADLVDADGASTPSWTFPSRAQCGECHTLAAGSTLGPELAQLNHAIEYPATGRTANQLDTLWAAGMLAIPPGAPAAGSLPSLVDVRDTGATLDERARSYLHANCANCHRPGGPTFTPLDLRFQTSLHDAGICNTLPTIDDLAAIIPTDPRILAPESPYRSVLWQRVNTIDESLRMPPIARSVTDATGSQVIWDWIIFTSSCP